MLIAALSPLCRWGAIRPAPLRSAVPNCLVRIAALGPSMPGELADRWASALADRKATNAKWKVLWIVCGGQDPEAT